MGVLHGLQCGYLFYCDPLPGLPSGNLLYWGPFQAVHGHLCSGAWSTSSTPPSLTLVAAGLFLTLFSLSSFTGLWWLCSFLNTSSQRCCLCGKGAQPCPVMGGMESSGTGHVQPWAVPASHHRPPGSLQAWAPTACSVNQDWFCPIAVVSDSSSFLLLFPWFLMSVLGSCPIERQDSALHIVSINSCATGGDSGPWLGHHSLVLHMNLPEYSRVLISFYILSADSAERSYPERPWRYILLQSSAALETAEVSCLSQ